jgi:RNA polymerase sigma-70 factor (ECF subfamily)
MATPDTAESLLAAYKEGGSGTLGATLSRAFDAAAAAWPQLRVDPERFLAFLAARIPTGASATHAIALLPVADLYLACACIEGEAAALRAFEQHLFGEVRAVYARVRPLGHTREDVEQMVRERLFVASTPGRPRIADYGGASSLRHWLRVVVARLLINLATRAPHDLSAGADLSEAIEAIIDEPEVEYLKQTYRAEARASFREAVAALEPRPRAVLRAALLDGCSIDDLAGVYSVHRATAARWLGDARLALGAELKKAMAQRLRVSPDELESILVLVRSQLELSLDRLIE